MLTRDMTSIVHDHRAGLHARDLCWRCLCCIDSGIWCCECQIIDGAACCVERSSFRSVVDGSSRVGAAPGLGFQTIEYKPGIALRFYSLLAFYLFHISSQALIACGKPISRMFSHSRGHAGSFHDLSVHPTRQSQLFPSDVRGLLHIPLVRHTSFTAQQVE